MMNDDTENSWSDFADAAANMFNVWVDGSELEWAKEAWGYLYAAGLASTETILNETAAKLRLVALAQIYQKFCGLAWDENPEMPLTCLAEELEINPLALGILAASEGTRRFDDIFEEYDLEEVALDAVSQRLKLQIFNCLKATYGDEFKLYTRLWHTRPCDDEDSEDEEFIVTRQNCVALSYVINGFQEG